MLAETIEDYSVTEHPKAAPAIALLLTDAQRSVARASTGKTWHSYLPFGHQGESSEHSTVSGFNGELRDPLTGHYWLGNGYRVFNTVLGRFQNPDAFSPFGNGGINTYAYCEGDPTNYTDPTGRARTKATELLRIRFQRLKMPKTNIARPVAHTTPALSETRQKIIEEMNEFDKRFDAGELRGRYTEYPALTGDPTDKGQQLVPEDIFQKIRTTYDFESNNTPSLAPYATTRGDGTSILDTYQFESSRRYYQSKALKPSRTPAERQVLNRQANYIEIKKRIYIKMHYNHRALGVYRSKELATIMSALRS
jgi:RHS repeat-associated protein